MIYKSAKFIKRLYKIVEDPEIIEIQWCGSGKRFIITDKDQFLKNILPMISKTKEYAAFVRLLNHYGFTKIVTADSNLEGYFHPNFFKGGEENTMFISRVRHKKPSTGDEIKVFKESNDVLKNDVEFLKNNNFRLTSEVIGLKEKLDKQEKTIDGLIEVLSRVFKAGVVKQRAIKDEDDTTTSLFKLKEQNASRLSRVDLDECLLASITDRNPLMLQNKEKGDSDDLSPGALNLDDFF